MTEADIIEHFYYYACDTCKAEGLTDVIGDGCRNTSCWAKTINKYLQSCQQLKAENENLKQERDLYKTWYRVKQLCLDEIEEICKDNFCIFADGTCDSLGDDILQKIKEVKGNEKHR